MKSISVIDEAILVFARDRPHWRHCSQCERTQGSHFAESSALTHDQVDRADHHSYTAGAFVQPVP